MQVFSYDSADERVALVALCLDSEVLGKVAATLPPEPFAGAPSNIIAGWCIRYWHQYKQAPGVAGLTAMHADWAASASKGTAETIAKLLGSLPPKIDMSADYAVDLIAKLVLRVSLKRMAEKISGALTNGKVEEAAALVQEFKRPELKTSSDSTFILQDLDRVDEVFAATKGESLIRFGGKLEPLGQFLGPTLSRDAFVAIQAPDKAGKSSHLAAFLLRGAMQGKRVAMINLGDLSRSQYLRRLYTSIVGWPVRTCKFTVPTDITYKDKAPTIAHSEHYAASGYTPEQVKEALNKYRQDDEQRFRLECYPAGRIDIYQIGDILKRWADDGWVPDIVGIDYADILADTPGTKDKKESVNVAWREMRALSTEYNCLLLTATQSDAEAYNTWIQGKSNFSNAKEKLAHVNAMIGVNVTELERSLQVARFNWIVLREREYLNQYRNSGVVAVAGAYAIGRPHTLATWI